MLLPDRLVARMAECGESQSSLARKVGMSPQMIGKLARGDSANTTQLHVIAQQLRTTTAFLTGQTEDPDEGAFVAPTPEEIAAQMGLIKVEEIDLAIGMGAAFLDEAVVNTVDRWMPEDWVRSFTDSPAAFLSIARPIGDSMYPTINDRDLVLIDRSHRRIDRQDGLWALALGGFGMIKRVWIMPDGSYKLKSDNPQVEAELAVDGEVFVIGRVAGVLRRT